MAAVQGHVQTALDHVTPDNWSKALDHVEGIERDFRQADGVMEDLQEAVVINIGADEAEESSSESESSESDSEWWHQFFLLYHNFTQCWPNLLRFFKFELYHIELYESFKIH